MDVSYWVTLTLFFFATIYIACSIISAFRNPKTNNSSTVNNTTIVNEADEPKRIRKYEFLVDLAKNTYLNELQRISNLDNKANTIIGFISVTISLLIGFGALEIFDKVTTKNYIMI